MGSRKILAHFLFIFGAFVTWNCLAESKSEENHVERLYQAMSDRISTLEVALLRHPAEIEKIRQEYRSEIDLLKKEHAEQISGLRHEIDSLRLEKETQFQELKEEVNKLRSEHESQIQQLKQLVFPHVMVNVDETEDKQENGNISTAEMFETETKEEENHHLMTNKAASSQGKMKGVQKSRTMRRQAKTMDHVAFFAKLSADSLNMGSNQVIKFDNCVTNVGNAYDSSIGVFRAPRAGVYLFSMTITTYSTKTGHIRIFINDVCETIAYVNGGQNAYDGISQTIIVSLKQGDNVTVRSTDMGHGVRGEDRSLFSGVLLFEDVGQGAIVG